MSSSEQLKKTNAIFGVPRSGTSWVGQICNSSPEVMYRYQPIFSYEFKERINEDSTAEEIDKFHSDLVGASSDFVLQTKNVSEKKEVLFDKNNPETLIWKEVRYLNLIPTLLERSGIKLILIVRHPAAVINSWLSAPKEFDSNWNPQAEWKAAELKNQGLPFSYYGYDKWREAMEMFLEVNQQYDNRVFLLKYEDMVEKTEELTQDMFGFMGLDLSKQTRHFIERSQSTDNNDPYGVFRLNQDVNRWRTELDDSIRAELLADFNDSDLAQRLGYENE